MVDLDQRKPLNSWIANSGIGSAFGRDTEDRAAATGESNNALGSRKKKQESSNDMLLYLRELIDVLCFMTQLRIDPLNEAPRSAAF